MNTYEFIAHVRNKVTHAFQLYNISHPVEQIGIDLSVRGKSCLGRAGYKYVAGERHYYMSFNPQALELNLDNMIDVIVPHEIAHLVCYLKPLLGKNHDNGWKSVCRSLGGTGNRTAQRGEFTGLISAKRVTRHEYNVLGRTISVGPKHHAAIQRGERLYTKRGNIAIVANMWIGALGSPKPVAPVMPKSVQYATPTALPKPVVPTAPAFPTVPKTPSTTGLTKAARAEIIFHDNPTMSRSDMIALFMTELDMGKAGASTYYQNIKSKNK